jgi:hypothetical protein
MGRNATEIERAVARSLRDSLEKLQRNTDEVSQAVGDLVSACSSARPSNTLPHLLRAQTAAASLAATLDVLSRFITSAIQPAWNGPFAPPETSPEAESGVPVEAEAQTETRAGFAPPAPQPAQPAFEPSEIEPALAAVEETLRTVASETAAFEQAAIVEPLQVVPLQGAAEVARQAAPPEVAAREVPEVAQERAPEIAQPVQVPQPPLDRPMFEVAALPADQQELHRRANRVAKVSMQDIKMLRPGDVLAGKENHDLCSRLRDDIERAHKEYERRFHAILDHPVDYFYAWMVEILGEGDPRSLGEYPYPSPVARR